MKASSFSVPAICTVLRSRYINDLTTENICGAFHLHEQAIARTFTIRKFTLDMLKLRHFLYLKYVDQFV